MKKLLGLILFLVANFVQAQIANGTYAQYFKEGNYLMLEENYGLALKNYLFAYELDSSSANINYNVGVCYLEPARQFALGL